MADRTIQTMRFLRGWLPVAAMCVVIYLFSRDSHSVEHSDWLLAHLLRVFGVATAPLVVTLSTPFRKFAHVCVYATLSVLTYRAFALGRGPAFNGSAAWRTLAFCAFYAATDEYHQRFVPTRGPSVHDVFIDTGGALLSIGLVWLFFHFRRGRGPEQPIPSPQDAPQSQLEAVVHE